MATLLLGCVLSSQAPQRNTVWVSVGQSENHLVTKRPVGRNPAPRDVVPGPLQRRPASVHPDSALLSGGGRAGLCPGGPAVRGTPRCAGSLILPPAEVRPDPGVVGSPPGDWRQLWCCVTCHQGVDTTGLFSERHLRCPCPAPHPWLGRILSSSWPLRNFDIWCIPRGRASPQQPPGREQVGLFLLWLPLTGVRCPVMGVGEAHTISKKPAFAVFL